MRFCLSNYLRCRGPLFALLFASAVLFASQEAAAERSSHSTSIPRDVVGQVLENRSFASPNWDTLLRPVASHLRIHGMGKVSIVFTEGKTLPPRARQGSTLLLRGWGRAPHRRLGRLSLRVSGAVTYRESGAMKLQLFLRRKGGKAPVRFFRVSLESAHPSVARVNSAPSFALLDHPCGASVANAAAEDSPALSPALSGLAVRETEVRTIADHLMVERYGADVHSQIAAFMNEADTVYVRDLDLTLSIVEQGSVDSSVLPGSIANSNTLLTTFQDYGLANEFLGTADVFHLFTTRNMNDNIIGLAYIGVVCAFPDSSFGLTQDINPALTPVVLAHELGHNFGAEHSSNGIMTAELGDPLPTGFATVSINQITSHVNLWGNICLDDTEVADPAPSVSLITSLKKNGMLRVVTNVAAVGTGCTLTLRASPQKANVSEGTAVWSFPSEAFSIDQTVSLGKVSPNAKVFLQAEHSCPDLTSTFSTAKALNPRANKQLKPNKFIQRMSLRFASLS